MVEAGQAYGNCNVFARVRLTSVTEHVPLRVSITDDTVVEEGGEKGESAVHFIAIHNKYFAKTLDGEVDMDYLYTVATWDWIEVFNTSE